MSDQQPGPDAPREPESPSAPPEAASEAGTPPPPVWPPHGVPGQPAPGQPAPGQAAPPPYPGQASYPPPGYPPVPATPGYPPAPGYAPAPGYPPYGYPPAQTTSTMAVVGLILSILSWVICPVVPAIVALVLASKSNQEIAASQGRVGGEGLNTATKIVSWINIGLYAAIAVILGAIFLIAIVAGAASGN